MVTGLLLSQPSTNCNWHFRPNFFSSSFQACVYVRPVNSRLLTIGGSRKSKRDAYFERSSPSAQSKSWKNWSYSEYLNIIIYLSHPTVCVTGGWGETG